MSHALSFTQPTSVRRGRSGVIALWVVQIALAGMFLLAGGSKLLGAPAMVALFNTIGIGQWQEERHAIALTLHINRVICTRRDSLVSRRDHGGSVPRTKYSFRSANPT